jgi:ribosomal protein S18 acetylase RimI-like enzyme
MTAQGYSATRLQVRSVGAESFEEMAALWTRAQAARGAPAGYAAGILEILRNRSTLPDAWFAAGTLDGRIAAYAHGLWGREKDGEGDPIPGLMHLSMVAVEPEFWGRGYGRKMAQFGITLSGVLGYRAIQLYTQPSNERAVRLYRSLGFMPIGRFKEDRGEQIGLYLLDLKKG